MVGRTSDPYILNNSDHLDNIEPGDFIVADRILSTRNAADEEKECVKTKKIT